MGRALGGQAGRHSSLTDMVAGIVWYEKGIVDAVVKGVD